MKRRSGEHSTYACQVEASTVRGPGALTETVTCVRHGDTIYGVRHIEAKVIASRLLTHVAACGSISMRRDGQLRHGLRMTTQLPDDDGPSRQLKEKYVAVLSLRQLNARGSQKMKHHDKSDVIQSLLEEVSDVDLVCYLAHSGGAGSLKDLFESIRDAERLSLVDLEHNLAIVRQKKTEASSYPMYLVFHRLMRPYKAKISPELSTMHH